MTVTESPRVRNLAQEYREKMEPGDREACGLCHIVIGKDEDGGSYGAPLSYVARQCEMAKITPTRIGGCVLER